MLRRTGKLAAIGFLSASVAGCAGLGPGRTLTIDTLAQSPWICELFSQDPDNTWVANHDFTVSSPTGPIVIRTTDHFISGVLFHGIDLAPALWSQCEIYRGGGA